MKVLWIVLGVLFGLCLICGGVGYFIFNKGMNVLTEAGKYGDDSFRAIATTWDLKELESRAAHQVTEQNGPEALPNLIEKLSTKLGPMKSFTSKLGGINSKNNNGNSYTTVEWNAEAEFEKGHGTATMTLINQTGKWEILAFNVESAALLAPESSSSPGTSSSGSGETSATNESSGGETTTGETTTGGSSSTTDDVPATTSTGG